MGLNIDFSVRILHTTTADSFWFAIKVVTLNLGNLVASIHGWCPYGWTDLWCSVGFVQYPLGLLPPQLTAALRMSFKMHGWSGLPHCRRNVCRWLRSGGSALGHRVVNIRDYSAVQVVVKLQWSSLEITSFDCISEVPWGRHTWSCWFWSVRVCTEQGPLYSAQREANP